MATKIAVLLMGKHRPSFERHVKTPSQIVITESDRLVLTGRKNKLKKYYRHSGYLGHLREFSAEEMRTRDSREIVRLAVAGMLPKNRLRKQLLKNLRIYKGAHREVMKGGPFESPQGKTGSTGQTG